jgi:uncharacterized protein (TIGR03435 family)
MFRRSLSIAALCSLAAAQSAHGAPRLIFEAASVRPSTSGSNGVSGGCRGSDTKSGGENRDIPLGRCVISAGRLSHLIGIAWQLNSMAMLRNAPDWVIGGDERFDIQAKAEDMRATEAQLLEMLQHLLEDRFQLKWHRENHEEHGFALVVAKDGPKLQESKEGEVTTLGPFNKGNPTVTISPHKVSMAMLANFLSTFGPGGTVADETGLRGDYNFTLTYNETDGPSANTALQRQLGLKLEPRSVQNSYFIIDSAARPGAN